MSELLLDLRGLRCPWPAIRVARALREAGEEAVILAVADDPAAPREIAASPASADGGFRRWRARSGRRYD